MIAIRMWISNNEKRKRTATHWKPKEGRC